MGRRDELGDRVCGPDVTRWPGRPRPAGGDVCRYPGDGSLQCLQLVPGAVAAAVLGASAPGFHSDVRPRGDSAALGEALLAQARQMFTWWHRVREGTLQRSTFRSYMSPLRREVERLLEAGSRSGIPKTAGTCQDILKRREALWTFVQVAGVEPTNNAAERALRPGVLWRKGSFGTQSAAGSRFVESMMTVVTTLKQQQRNVWEYLTTACDAALRGDTAPSLLPVSDQQSQAVA